MNKKLNFWDCMGFCIGQIIGSGIMVLTGIVIGFTGHGTPLAFILAACLAITTMIPFTFLASTLPTNGAGYNYIKRLIGNKAGFFYLCSFVLTQVLIATYAKGFASYFVAVFPSFNEAAVAAGVLPVDMVAGKPLTLVAEKILPAPLYVYFIIGGAWCAIVSTLNSQFASATKPLIQAAEDGWLPICVAKIHKKYRTPVYLLFFYLMIGVLPVVFNINIGIIGSICSVVSGLMATMVAFCLLVFPKKYPKEWEKCPLRLSDFAIKVLIILSVLIAILQTYFLLVDLSTNLIIGNVLVIVFGFLFSLWRIRSKKVKMIDSFEPIEV